jgi:hypothetical protein
MLFCGYAAMQFCSFNFQKLTTEASEFNDKFLCVLCVKCNDHLRSLW